MVDCEVCSPAQCRGSADAAGTSSHALYHILRHMGGVQNTFDEIPHPHFIGAAVFNGQEIGKVIVTPVQELYRQCRQAGSIRPLREQKVRILPTRPFPSRKDGSSQTGSVPVPPSPRAPFPLPHSYNAPGQKGRIGHVFRCRRHKGGSLRQRGPLFSQPDRGTPELTGVLSIMGPVMENHIMNFLQQPPGRGRSFNAIETIGQEPAGANLISFAVFRPRQLQGRRRLRLYHFLCSFLLFPAKGHHSGQREPKAQPGHRR